MTTISSHGSGWRVVDIVVAAVIAVAFGVVFQAWNVLWETTTFVAPPIRGAIYGVWMIPAVLVPLVVRRPGAALFGETVAAMASMLFGAQWGLLTVVYGLAQGAAAELAFAFGIYRRWSLPGLSQSTATTRRSGRWPGRHGSRLTAGACGTPDAAIGRCAVSI
ncbi:MAG: ECF transporter S component [Chloroflexi bacterium]|nr:ECF transporter S component [Chloroflexota bacterium]